MVVDKCFILHVHVLVTDGRFLSAGSNQLHQDLEGVDGHRPNLWHEVEGLDVRLFKFNTQQGTSLIVEKSRR